MSGKTLDTMSRVSRRTFLAGSAAMVSAPALGAAAVATRSPNDVDVIIVGAGAAGIAAARRLVASGARYALLEAADRVGGRCVTDTTTFGVPYDRGAHWLHLADVNPLVKLAPETRLDIYPAAFGQRVRIGRRNAREGELEDFLSAQVRANRAIADAARSGKADISAAQALPRDLGDWRATIEFVLGPMDTAKDLAELSAADYARADEGVDMFCRQGYGALVARLADGLTVRLSSPVTRIEWDRGGIVEAATAGGTVRGRAVIVTVSTGVLGGDTIRFTPELPKRITDALARLKLGSHDRIALELNGNPLGLQRDELVLEKSDGPHTAGMLANVSGTPLSMIDVGGSFGRDLAGQGEAAMIAFATDWLANLYGNDVKKAVQRSHAMRWGSEPYVRGAWSAASPGGQPGRKILAEPQRDRLWFAGEATHETAWGTVGGAWESGERAAAEILRKLGFVRDPAPAKAAPKAVPRVQRPVPR